MWRHLTERLHDPGSNGVFCAPPSPPRCVLGGGDNDNTDWVARGLSSSENGFIVASTLRWSSASLLPSGGDRGGGEKARGALAGVRRTSIEAGRYKVGWTRLSAGGRKRRAKASAAGTGIESRGRGASSGAAGDGNAWGPDDHAADAPPSHFGEGGLSSRPQAIIAYPWTAMAQTVGTEVEE